MPQRILLAAALLLIAVQWMRAEGIIVHKEIGDPNYTITEGVDFVSINASKPGSIAITAPDGYLLHFYGSAMAGTIVAETPFSSYYGNALASGQWSECSTVFFYAGRVEVEGDVNAVAYVEVFNPNAISSEDKLRFFLEHNYYSKTDYSVLTQHLKLSDDIRLESTCKVQAEYDIELDLNGHTISRSLNSQSSDGSVLAVASGGKLTIKDSSGGNGMITGGWTTGKGGGIRNEGTLIVEDGQIVGNKATTSNGKGGGIYNCGTCTVIGGDISDNQAQDCGGIFNDSGGTLTIEEYGAFEKINIWENTSYQGGGGVVNYGTAYIRDCSIYNNCAKTRGGGVWNGGTLEISGSARISTNYFSESSPALGGGIFNREGATLIIKGGSIDNNVPVSGGNKAYNGGGVYNLGTLTMTGGSITGNSVRYQGGGVYNDEKNGQTTCMFNMSGGSINSNNSVGGGGGVFNRGTMVMGGGSIRYNTNASNGNGAGIKIDNNDASSITMFGTPVVNGDKNGTYHHNVVYLPSGKKIKLSSSLQEGADVWVECYDGYCIPITDGGTKSYLELHPGARPDDYIHYQGDGLIIYNNEIARLPYSTVQYVGEDGQTVKNEQCMLLSKLIDNRGVSFGLGHNDAVGTFLMNANMTFNNRINVVGNAKLILYNDKTLTAKGGIDVSEGSSLAIYRQSLTGTAGKIVATASGANAGIGGSSTKNSGPIAIYGGNITATGDDSGAGIGGGIYGVPSSIKISNATVTATGGTGAAGIGTGWRANIWKYDTQQASQRVDVAECVYNYDITISNGSTVTATGKNGGAGIGGGTETYFLGTVNIEGGNVTVTGSSGDRSAAGIGSGYLGSCYLFRFAQAEPMERYATINISGGEILAKGGKYAASIGGGMQYYNNPVIDPDTYEGGNLPTIQGGGANVHITGGSVRLWSSDTGYKERNVQGIGHGAPTNGNYNLAPSGSLDIYDEAMVTFPNIEASEENQRAPGKDRIDYLRYYGISALEPCDHRVFTDNTYSGYKNPVINARYHSSCKFCLAADKMDEHDFKAEKYNQCDACELISLPDSADNTAVLEYWADASTHTFTLTGRKFAKDGDWYAVCLPFSNVYSTNPMSDAIAMELDSASFDKGELTLKFKRAQEVRAKIPYIVKWEKTGEEIDTITDPLFWNVMLAFVPNHPKTMDTPDTVSVDITDKNGDLLPDTKIHFLGSFVPKTWPAGTPYDTILLLGGKNTLFYPNGEGDSWMNSFRSYFELEGLTAGDYEEPDAPFVRSFNLNFGDGEQTGISAPEIGVLSHRRTRTDREVVYDLQGRRVADRPSVHRQLPSGLYIIGGRKVVVK